MNVELIINPKIVRLNWFPSTDEILITSFTSSGLHFWWQRSSKQCSGRQNQQWFIFVIIFPGNLSPMEKPSIYQRQFWTLSILIEITAENGQTTTTLFTLKMVFRFLFAKQRQIPLKSRCACRILLRKLKTFSSDVNKIHYGWDRHGNWMKLVMATSWQCLLNNILWTK